MSWKRVVINMLLDLTPDNIYIVIVNSFENSIVNSIERASPNSLFPALHVSLCRILKWFVRTGSPGSKKRL